MTELIFLDTCFLIGLLEESSIFNKKANTILKDIARSQNRGIINSHVLNELHYFYLRHYNTEKAFKAMKCVFQVSNIKYQDIELTKDDIIKISKLSIKYNLKTFDAYHLYYCKKLGIKTIATFDEDFNKVKSMKVLN